MEKELKLNDLVVKDVLNNSEYTAVVKLSSCGKLGLPPVLHVKDYSFEDTVLYAKATDQNESKIILSIIKNVVYEDIDITKVTAQDALEILMTIQGTFYSAYIDGLRYYVDETLKGEELIDKDNIRVATIPISKINTIPLKSELKTPINIETKNCKVKFDYPRLIHDSLAVEYINNKFAEEDNVMNQIKLKIKNHTETLSELNEYSEYSERRFDELMKVMNALQLLEYNGKVLDSIDDKIKYIDRIPAAVMTIFNAVITEKFKFGIDPEVTFEDEVDEKLITRRFNFRFSHFLQTLEYRNDADVRISFG